MNIVIGVVFIVLGVAMVMNFRGLAWLASRDKDGLRDADGQVIHHYPLWAGRAIGAVLVFAGAWALFA